MMNVCSKFVFPHGIELKILIVVDTTKDHFQVHTTYCCIFIIAIIFLSEQKNIDMRLVRAVLIRYFFSFVFGWLKYSVDWKSN